MYYHEPTVPRYARPMGSALGKYNKIGAPHDGYPIRAGICYRDLSDIDIEYDCNGSRGKNKWDFFYGDRLEPIYLRPMGSALGRYTNQAPLDNAGFPKRTGICYRDASNVTATYITNGSRITDFFGGKDDEKILRFIYAIMSELGSRSVGKYAGIARDSCTMAYATDDRFGSRGWTITTKYQM